MSIGDRSRAHNITQETNLLLTYAFYTLQMLSDIHRSLVEDARTKDLFRDEGGFLALISVLSGLRPAQEEGSEGSGVLVDLEVEEVQRVECLRSASLGNSLDLACFPRADPLSSFLPSLLRPFLRSGWSSGAYASPCRTM